MRAPKYRNRKTVADGITFHSAKEARRYGELKLLERAGEIHGLRLQPSFDLTVNGVKIGRIVPDFSYIRDGKPVCEDVKSPATITPIFKWKARHLAAERGIVIKVVL